jgi:hypothetical protein
MFEDYHNCKNISSFISTIMKNYIKSDNSSANSQLK